jgi:hypothetical protein
VVVTDVSAQPIGPSSRVKKSIPILHCFILEIGPTICPKKSVNYQSTLHNIPEERRSHLHCGRSVESCNIFSPFKIILFFFKCFLKFNTRHASVFLFWTSDSPITKLITVGISQWTVLALVVKFCSIIAVSELFQKIMWAVIRYTGQFKRPSGISDLCGTVAGMVTPKGSMSTEGETLQVSALPYRCSICPPLGTRQISIL